MGADAKPPSPKPGPSRWATRERERERGYVCVRHSPSPCKPAMGVICGRIAAVR